MIWEKLLSIKRDKGKSSTESIRTSFEQDFDRIIFSHPFRKLQDKTQVHPLPEQDFVHTRLTHSLEVSSVARSLGREVGNIITGRHTSLLTQISGFDFGAITAAAALAHDLGNPPFGHTGEEALSDFFINHGMGQSIQKLVSEAAWSDLIRFEGNAQGLRILYSQQYGLNLTQATRGAFIKYPCPVLKTPDLRRKSQKKFGVFQSELAEFRLLSVELGLKEIATDSFLRHPLAFLVEAADDICYSIIDLEDGCRLGLISLEQMTELVAPILGKALDPEKLSRCSGLNEKLSILRAMTIGELIRDCAGLFSDVELQILNGDFDKALTDSGNYAEALKDIQKVSVERIYRARHVTEIEAAGFQILPGLMEIFSEAALDKISGKNSGSSKIVFRLLPEDVRSEINQHQSDVYLVLRAVIDFISGLTDRHAVALYRKLKGISIG
jgi:dGTPase